MVRSAFAFVMLAFCVSAGKAANLPVEAQISISSVPAGCLTQIRLSLVMPHPILRGAISLDLDPSVFGDIAAVNAISATGDQIGLAYIKGRHADVEFVSGSGGIGRLGRYPMLTVDVPVLPGVAPEAQTSVTMNPNVAGVPWKDLKGDQLAVTVRPAVFRTGGSLSISGVSPGGGMLEAGDRVSITGAGFTSATAIEIDGVSISSLQIVNAQQIDVTLGGAAELTGKRLTARNPGGEPIEYFVFLKGDLRVEPYASSVGRAQPIFPISLSSAVSEGFLCCLGNVFSLQNQTAAPVTITFVRQYITQNRGVVNAGSVTISSGETYAGDFITWMGCSRCGVSAIASVPIRMVTFRDYSPLGLRTVSPEYAPYFPDVSTIQVGLLQVEPEIAVGPYSWDWQIGSPVPEPKIAIVQSLAVPMSFKVSTTTDEGSWLSVSPLQGLTCGWLSPESCPPETTKLTITADPSSLRPGVHHGKIVVTAGPAPGAPNPVPSVTDVVLNVSQYPVISISPDRFDLSAESREATPRPQILNVNSNGAPVQFSVETKVDAGPSWIVVTPSRGIAPATLTVTADPAKFPATGYATGTVTVTGAGNTKTIRVSLYVNLPLAPPSPLLLYGQAGTSTVHSQTVSLPSPGSASACTTSGGDWLSCTLRGFSGIAVSVNAARLPAGNYVGNIQITLASGETWQVAVGFVVYGSPPPLSVTPSSLSLTTRSGSSATGVPNISTGDIPIEYEISKSADTPWIQIYDSGTRVTPDSVKLTAGLSNVSLVQGMPPGVHRGSVTISAPPGSSNSVTVPVTLTVTPWIPEGPPLGASVVNAASQIPGAVSAGEMVSIYGMNLNDTTVVFDGIPATVLYSSLTQINTVVPRDVFRKPATNIEFQSHGSRTFMGGVAIVPAAPAIFTVDGTGQGRASVLNGDDSVNDASNPAVRGTVIQLFGTGEGFGVDRWLLPVSVTIGGIDAAVQEWDSAGGLLRTRVVIPQSSPTGPSVPVRLKIGGIVSQEGVVVAVR